MLEKAQEKEGDSTPPGLPKIDNRNAMQPDGEEFYDPFGEPTYELYVAAMERLGAAELTLPKEDWEETAAERMRNDAGKSASQLEAPPKIYALLEELGVDRARIDAHQRRIQDLLNGEPLTVEGPTIDGGHFDIAQYAGEVVLIHFWRCSCGPCREKLPQIKKLLETYSEHGFKVVGVCGDTDLEQVREVAKSEGITWPTICTGRSANPIIENIKLWIYPVMLLQNRQGKTIEADPKIGRLPDLIRALLDE